MKYRIQPIPSFVCILILLLLLLVQGCSKSGRSAFEQGAGGEAGDSRVGIGNPSFSGGMGGSGGISTRMGAGGGGDEVSVGCEQTGEEICDGVDNDCDGLEDEGQVCEIVDFSAKYNHVCVVLANSRVKCWGSACEGKLGNAPGFNQACIPISGIPVAMRQFSHIGDEPGEMDTGLGYVSLGDFQAADIETGGSHTCAISVGGRTKCWGEGLEGQLGYENDDDLGNFVQEMGDALLPVDIGTDTNGDPYRVLSMSLGGRHSCALVGAATVLQPDLQRIKCWGDNTVSQLGQGETLSNHVGDEIDEMGDALDFSNLGEDDDGFFSIVDIDAGNTATCARLEGRAKCFGSTGDNTFAVGSRAVYFSGDRVGNALQYAELTTEGMADVVHSYQLVDDHACAIVGDGRVKCWGENEYGQLGDGTTLDFEEDFEFLEYVDFGTDDNGMPLGVTQLTVGRYHSCVVLAGEGVPAGKIKCWGKNDVGQLGYEIDVMQVPEEDRPAAMNKGDDLGEMGDNLPFVNLGANAEVVRIEAANDFTCALLASGDLRCWGNNEFGQLGQGHAENLGDNANEMGDRLRPILY